MIDLPALDHTNPNELMTRQEVADLFGVTKRTIMDTAHKMKPPIPYIRMFRKVFYSRRQVFWWIAQIQALPDPVAVDIRRAPSLIRGK